MIALQGKAASAVKQVQASVQSRDIGVGSCRRRLEELATVQKTWKI